MLFCEAFFGQSCSGYLTYKEDNILTLSHR